MPSLVVPSRPEPDRDGNVLTITPESAGWQYVGFQVYVLKKGQTLSRTLPDQEACLVLLSGRATVSAGEHRWEHIGERMNVFEKTPPYSVYVPSGAPFCVEALTELELAVCLAPGKGTHEPRLIRPQDVGVEMRGYGQIERKIHNILPEGQPADSLLVVEVFTPAGHWSSYPPHKHDRNQLPEESYLEETYYHRIDKPGGFAIQRVYTDDRSLDETMTVKDGDAVLVPRGYHPVCAPPGYEVYYLNVMAGPIRTWKFRNDPDHEWLLAGPAAPRG